MVIHDIDKSARTSARINTVAQQQIGCGQTSFASLQQLKIHDAL